MSNGPKACSYSFEIINTLQTVLSALQESASVSKQCCGLVTLSPQFSIEHGDVSRCQLVETSLHYYLQALRQLVRKTDSVYLLDSTFYFVLPDANSEGAAIVEARLWDAMLWYVHNAPEANMLQPHRMTIGHAAHLASSKDVHTCVVDAAAPSYSVDTQPGAEPITAGVLQEKDEVTPVADKHPCADEFAILARKLGMPYLSPLPRKKPEQVQRLVTLKLAHELQCYPLGRERGTLTVALSNPEDHSVLSRLHQETGLRIFPVLTPPQELQTALNGLV